MAAKDLVHTIDINYQKDVTLKPYLILKLKGKFCLKKKIMIIAINNLQTYDQCATINNED